MATTFAMIDAAGATLASGGTLEGYVPASPDRRIVEAYNNGDGSMVSAVSYGVVEDTATVIVDGTRATIESVALAYMRAFEQARESVGNRAAPVVYVLYGQDSAPSGRWRSRILGGSVEYDQTILESWPRGKARLTLRFRREFFWEAETEVGPLTIVGVSAGVNRCRVTNGPYGINYVTVPAAQLSAGSLKTPLRIEMQYTYATSGSEPRGIYVISNTWTRDAGDVVNGLEAELPINGGRGTPGYGSADVFDSTCSGGWRRTSPTITTTWAPAFGVTLDTAFLEIAKGGLYDIIARFPTNLTSGQWLKAQLRLGSQVLWESSPIQHDGDELQSLGTFRFPATALLPDVAGSMVLVIMARTASGTSTLSLDYVQFIPTDGKLNVYLAGGPMAFDNYLHLDQARGLHYTTNAAGQADLAQVRVIGSLFVWPGRSAQVSFLWESDWVGGLRSSVPQQWFDVRMFYRPRKASW
ncbi:MAG TPA: hypothetical protein PLC98_17045 [Anaerolineales bacterium]|nr:hypothetical protein [Anaerolineales bacterium]